MAMNTSLLLLMRVCINAAIIFLIGAWVLNLYSYSQDEPIGHEVHNNTQIQNMSQPEMATTPLYTYIKNRKSLRESRVVKNEVRHVYCPPLDGGLSEAVRLENLLYCPITLSSPTGQYRTIKTINNSIAVGLGITTRNFPDLNSEEIDTTLSFFSQMLPSFCDTASEDYHYVMYVAYDHTDPFLSESEDNVELFKAIFRNMERELCRSRDVYVALKLLQCSHSGKPAWAQNDAMVEAYFDGMEYFHRINDDTVFQTTWTEEYIRDLAAHPSPNLGVVGPSHTGGNLVVLTHDFVHRTHLEIFGFYYPRQLPHLYADVWIMWTYSPKDYTRTENVAVNHTRRDGTRYNPNDANRTYFHVGEESLIAKEWLERWKYSKKTPLMASTRSETGSLNSNWKSSKVVCLTLVDNEHYYQNYQTAMRTVIFVSRFMPGWRVRVYTNSPPVVALQAKLDKLRKIGAEIALLTCYLARVAVTFWPYYVIDDMRVTRFLVWNDGIQYHGRDLEFIRRWLNSNDECMMLVNQYSLHDVQRPVLDIFGGIPGQIRNMLGHSWTEFLDHHLSTNSMKDSSHIESIMWAFYGRLKYECRSYNMARLGWIYTKELLEYRVFLSRLINTRGVVFASYEEDRLWPRNGDSSAQLDMDSPSNDKAIDKKQTDFIICYNSECHEDQYMWRGPALHLWYFKDIHYLNSTTLPLSQAETPARTNGSLLKHITQTHLDWHYLKQQTGIKSTLLQEFCTSPYLNWMALRPAPNSTRLLFAMDGEELPAFIEHAFRKLWASLDRLVRPHKLHIFKYTSIGHEESYSIRFLDRFNQHYSGVLFIPDAFNSSTFCEIYSAAIPMLLPSVDRLLSWHLYMPQNFLHDAAIYVHAPFSKKWSSQYVTELRKTLKSTDYYQRKHILYFSSFDDALEMLSKMGYEDFKKLYDQIYHENVNYVWEMHEVMGNFFKNIA